MSPKLDPNKSWVAVETRMNAETNPRTKRALELVFQHMQREAAADIEGVVATLCDTPRYVMHDNPTDARTNPDGSKDAVRAFYDATIVQTGAHRLEFDVERVIADETAVFTEGIMRMAYPGRTLQAMGMEPDDLDAYYLAQSRMGIVWPVDPDDPEGRLTGEEVYAPGNTFDGVLDRRITLDDIVPLSIS